MLTHGRMSFALAVPLALAVVLSGCSSTSSSTKAPTTSTSTTSAAAAVPPSTLAGGTVATGSVTCTNLTGMFTFTPPLTDAGTSPETIQISLTASGCATTGSSVSQVTSATATATIKSATNGCTSLLTSKPVAVAVAWNPSSIHASVASFSGYAIVADAAGHVGFELPATGGTASVAGSFAGSDNGAKSSAAAYSGFAQTQLLTACGAAGGVPAMPIASGTVTFA